MIEILSAGGLATVQDQGRFGCYRYGVSQAGAMDQRALAIGNALLGNAAGAAGIEIAFTPFRLRLHADLSIALAGADCGASLDGQPLPPFWAVHARAGQVLALGAMRAGGRAYLAVHGGIDVPMVLGSRSTQLRGAFGGLEGRLLGKGDRLQAQGGDAGLPEGGLGANPPALALPLGGDGTIRVRVLPADEHGSFTPAARALFWSAGWKITAQSNRTGYFLTGPELRMTETIEMRSHGVVPGTIQVPPSGMPLIQFADAQTMGGYPKIGVVIDADLWRAAQGRPGDVLAFVETDYAGAVRALDELEAYLAAVRRVADWQRQSAARKR